MSAIFIILSKDVITRQHAQSYFCEQKACTFTKMLI